MNNRFALDIGSANLIASSKSDTPVICEPSVIAVNRRTGSISAVGQEATGADISDAQNTVLMRPFRNGLMANCDITYRVMADMLKRSFGRELRGARLLLSIPCDLDEIGESVLIELALKTGVKTCHLIYAPLAAMASEFISPFSSCLLADIGAVRTNVMLLTKGKIRYLRAANVGGESFDAAIIDYLLQKYKMQINRRQAEQIKMKIGTVYNDGVTAFQRLAVNGKNIVTGEGMQLTLDATDMYEAFEEPMAGILEAICLAITKIPPSDQFEVLKNGISLCGGGALLHGMSMMIEGITGYPTVTVDSPQEATAIGMARIQDWLPTQIPAGIRNISAYYIENFLPVK